jgi:hypothetical protein
MAWKSFVVGRFVRTRGRMVVPEGDTIKLGTRRYGDDIDKVHFFHIPQAMVKSGAI